MRNKIVLWGTNPQDERILVALELQIEANKVLVHTFPEAIATDDFYQQMMDQWRSNQEVAFPEGHQVLERELNITESLLPEEIKVERGDLIQRAQTEWQFVVLSSKLSQAYRSELDELEDRIGNLKKFDDKTWESLKGFWSKVQSQLRDRTLLREHADELRDRTNKAFDTLKKLRSKREEEFRQFSKENMEKFNGFLDDIDHRIKENKALAKIFEELKRLQQELREMDFTRDHRNKLWQRIDKAFKVVKEKRFGEKGGGDSSPLERLKRRYNGLLSALEKMERSIQRDESDLEFSQRKVNRTDGQLEAQILQAKIQMIEQRVASKREKLQEMLQTKTTLEARLEKEKERQAKREEQKRVAEARDAAKEKIAQKIKAKQEELDEKAEEIESAVKAVKGDEAPAAEPTPAPEPSPEEPAAEAEPKAEPKAEPEAEPLSAKRDDSLLEAIGNTISESLEDVVDTVRAVAEVVGQQIEEKIDEIKEDMKAQEEE